MRGAVAVISTVALAACASGSSALAPGPVPSVAANPSSAPKTAASPATTAPAPTDPPGLVPLAPHRAPADFTGDDAEFVRQVRGNLEQEKVTSTLSDSRLLSLGREFCSVLSGGGLLTDKVEHWVGSRDLKEGADVAIVLAAHDALCGDLTDGYNRLQLSEVTVPTDAERADLARFITTLDQPVLEKSVAEISDSDLSGDAADACELDFDDEWWNSTEARKLEGGLPELARMSYVVGLVTAFCPDVADQLIDSLEDWAG